MLKCPNHDFSNEIIVNNFYARLSHQDKDMIHASSMGSFTNQKVDAKWDLIGRIQRNTEDWAMDKGKKSGIDYEYDCIKSFVKTKKINRLSAKYGLDSQIIVDFCKTFASHVNMPKVSGTSFMNLLRIIRKRILSLIKRYLSTLLTLFYLVSTLKKHLLLLE